MKLIRSFFRKYTEDLLLFAGLLCILIGTIQINPIAAWFVGGVECLGVGFMLAWNKRK